MNRNSKKGFTIVELIIVIVVIAVLAAVLIPTFSNLIQKANEAKDTALVSNLNKGLKMSSKDFATMHEALQAVEENVGVNVEKISAVATDSKILWDSVNNCFVYLKSGDTKPTYIPDSQKTTIADNEQYKYWEIVETARNDKIYSQYLAGDNHNEAVTVNTGFDAGKNANLVSVTYTNTDSQSVVIRTNGGELVVDAGNATVAHYGAANYVNIKNVYKDSFHEYGVAAVVRIEKGHFVAEATAKVINLNVASNSVKITENEGAKVFEYSTDQNATETIEVTVNGSKIDNVEAKDVGELKKDTEVIAEGGVAEIDGIQFKSLQSAFDTAKDGQTVTLLEDIDLNLTVSLKQVKSITLDANGKTVKNLKDLWRGNNWSLISVRQGCLTITGNGSFLAKSNDCFAVDVQDGATLTIENGVFDGNIHAVYVLEGTAYIKGGTYSVQQKYSDPTKADEFVLNLLDENRDKGTARMYVTGGSFYNFNPMDCWAEGANTNFCQEGYGVATDAKGEYIFENTEVGGQPVKIYTVVKAN